MHSTYMGVPFVLTRNDHMECHIDSVDRFPPMGNRRMILARGLGQDTGNIWGEWPIAGGSARPSFGYGGPSEKLR